MIARAKQTPGAANNFIPPYLFLWRHCIELQLKETLEMVASNAAEWTKATGQTLPANFFVQDIRESHSLLTLWQRLSPLVDVILRKPQPDWHLPALPMATIAALIKQLHQIDPAGDGVRYDRRKDGDPTMRTVNRVDLEHAQGNLLGIAEFLLWADREIGTTLGGLCETQVIAVYPIDSAKILKKLRHAAQNNKQRLLRPIERRFLHHTLITERSRCDSIVCQA